MERLSMAQESALKLNKQGDNIQAWHTPFPILNQPIVPCLVLTVVSWPAYKFLRRQVRWSGIPISDNFPQFVVTHTAKGFSTVSEAEADVFLKFLCFLYHPTYVGHLISDSFAFSKSRLFGHIRNSRVNSLSAKEWRGGDWNFQDNKQYFSIK